MCPTVGEARIIKDRWLVNHGDISMPSLVCLSNYMLPQAGRSKLLSMLHETANDHLSPVLLKVHSELDGRSCFIMVQVCSSVHYFISSFSQRLCEAIITSTNIYRAPC